MPTEFKIEKKIEELEKPVVKEMKTFERKKTNRLPWFFLILIGRVVEEVVAEDEEEPDGVGLLP